MRRAAVGRNSTSGEISALPGRLYATHTRQHVVVIEMREGWAVAVFSFPRCTVGIQVLVKSDAETPESLGEKATRLSSISRAEGEYSIPRVGNGEYKRRQRTLDGEGN